MPNWYCSYLEQQPLLAMFQSGDVVSTGKENVCAVYDHIEVRVFISYTLKN